MTRKEKLALLDAIQEKKRRLREQRALYMPNEGQHLVHICDKTVRLVTAGNGSGKTTLGVQEALWGATGYNPIRDVLSTVPARIIIVLDKPEKVADVWLPEMYKWFNIKPENLHKRGKPYISQIILNNGSELLFMFHDQDPMSFESIEADAVIFDEPPPRSVYISLRRAGRKLNSRPWFLIIATPISAAWLRKEIYEPWIKGESTDTECFRYGTNVNKENLADGYIESFRSVLSEKEQRIRLEGEFFDLEGLALAHLFDRSHHIIKQIVWPSTHPCVIAIDPHPKKKHTAILLGIDRDNQLFALKETSSRSIPSKFAQELKEWYAGFNVVDIVCDSLGSSELTGGSGNLSFIRVLQDNGVRVRPTTFNEKKDEAWIQNIQEALAIPQEADNFGRRQSRLKFSENVRGLINDVETVEWEKYRNMDEFKPKLAIGNKDFLACLKYALAAEPRFTKGRDRIIRSANSGSWNNREKWR